jgi:hypothetical protein
VEKRGLLRRAREDTPEALEVGPASRAAREETVRHIQLLFQCGKLNIIAAHHVR